MATLKHSINKITTLNDKAQKANSDKEVLAYTNDFMDELQGNPTLKPIQDKIEKDARKAYRLHTYLPTQYNPKKLRDYKTLMGKWDNYYHQQQYKNEIWFYYYTLLWHYYNYQLDTQSEPLKDSIRDLLKFLEKAIVSTDFDPGFIKHCLQKITDLILEQKESIHQAQQLKPSILNSLCFDDQTGKLKLNDKIIFDADPGSYIWAALSFFFHYTKPVQRNGKTIYDFEPFKWESIHDYFHEYSQHEKCNHKDARSKRDSVSKAFNVIIKDEKLLKHLDGQPLFITPRGGYQLNPDLSKN